MYQTSIRNKKKISQFNKVSNNNYIIDKEYELYAYVIKLLGNCRALVLCDDGNEAIGVIRGSMRRFNKRVLISSITFFHRQVPAYWLVTVRHSEKRYVDNISSQYNHNIWHNHFSPFLKIDFVLQLFVNVFVFATSWRVFVQSIVAYIKIVGLFEIKVFLFLLLYLDHMVDSFLDYCVIIFYFYKLY